MYFNGVVSVPASRNQGTEVNNGVVHMQEGCGNQMLRRIIERNMWWKSSKPLIKRYYMQDNNSKREDIFTHWRRKWQPTPVFLPGES